MKWWILIALLAQLFNAVVVLLDKYLLSSKTVDRPLVYAFYISLLSGVVVLLLPFGVVLLPTARIIWLSLVIAVTYTASILFLYRSLILADASDVAPTMGAIAALATLLASLLILGHHLSENFLIGFVFLVVGTFLMSYFRFSRRSFFYVLLAGTLFGLSSVLVKVLFLETSFWNGFFWSRWGNVMMACLFLIRPNHRQAIWGHLRFSSWKTKVLIGGNKALAGFAFLLILLAIKLGDVAIVNAINGTQFVFLILLALIFTPQFPKYFYESIRQKRAVLQKVAATIFIVVGYFLLFI